MKNRIRFLFVPACFLLINQACAQDESQGSRFRAGFTLGPVASDIKGTDTRDNDSDFDKLGFCVGGIVSTSLGQKTTLQIELNYIEKGAQQAPDSNNQGYFKLSLNYLEIPVVYKRKIRMNIRRKPVDRLEIQAGASFARLVGYKYDVGNYGLEMDATKLNFTDVSIFAGIAFNFTPHIAFCIRYSNSVIPALKRNKIDPEFFRYEYNSGNNQVVLMALQYTFGKVKPEKTKIVAPVVNPQ